MFSQKGRSKQLRTTLVIGTIALLAFAVIIGGLTPSFRVSYQTELVAIDAPLQTAIFDDESLEQIMQRIEDDPKVLKVVDPIFGSAMDGALSSDRIDIVEMLLKNGWALRDINQPMTSHGNRNTTPLGMAVLNDSVGMARLLIYYGADPRDDAMDDRNARDLCKDIPDPEIQRAMMEVLRESTLENKSLP